MEQCGVVIILKVRWNHVIFHTTKVKVSFLICLSAAYINESDIPKSNMLGTVSAKRMKGKISLIP